jgi:hypothetical protein
MLFVTGINIIWWFNICSLSLREEGGNSYSRYINEECMFIVISVLVFLAIMAIGYGIHNVDDFEFILELKLYNNPYYRIGLSFDVYEDDVYEIEEFVIGMFFINFRFIFYKFSA